MASMPPSRAAAVLSNGLSPISSSTTSLPEAFSDRAIASTVNAVSTDSERAKLLNCADTNTPFGAARVLGVWARAGAQHSTAAKRLHRPLMRLRGARHNAGASDVRTPSSHPMRLTVIIRTLGVLFLLFSTTLLPPIGISLFYDDGGFRHL